MACWWGKTPPPRHRRDVFHPQAWPYPPVAVDGAALRRATQEYASDADRRESTERQAGHRPKKATSVRFHTFETSASRFLSGGRHGATPPQGAWSMPRGVSTASPGARANQAMYASHGSWHFPNKRVATTCVRDRSPQTASSSPLLRACHRQLDTFEQWSVQGVAALISSNCDAQAPR